jgi:hypothetical protein
VVRIVRQGKEIARYWDLWEKLMQFSKQPTAAAPSEGRPKMRSHLVCRLVGARDDPGKDRIRMWLIDLDDAQLRSGLGLTVEDIAVLRTGTKAASALR